MRGVGRVGRNSLSPTKGLWCLQLLERSVSSCHLISCLWSILSSNSPSTQPRKAFPFMSLLKIETYVSVILIRGKMRAWWVESRCSPETWDTVSS